MKRLFSLALGVLALTVGQPQEVKAQTEKPEFVTVASRDTCTNGDTVMITLTKVASNIKSIQATVSKVSGTVTGYVILQASDDGNFIDISTDTLANTNQATNTKIWVLTSTSYRDYRIVYRVASGTQKSVLSLSYARRPDEQ